jgi:hypothetical protein
LLYAIAPGYKLNRHQVRLYNTTAASVIAYGPNTENTSLENVTNPAIAMGFVTSGSSFGVRVEHNAQTAAATGGGRSATASYTTENTYTTLLAMKIA